MPEYCDVYFWRQCFILFSDYIHCFGAGFFMSFPTVLNAAILSPNSTDLRATPDQASWIAGSQGITGVLGFIIMPAIMQAYGRKAAHYGLNCAISVGFIIFVFAPNVTWLYIARLIQGLALSGVYITSVIVAEYSDKKRRAYFTSIKKSAVAFGSLVCHSLIVVLTWRKIALIGALSNVLAMFLTILWPESPAYLALKGKFEKCDKSHTWLNGNTQVSRKELEDLIFAQTERRKKIQDGYIRRIWNNITVNNFLKPIVITTLLTLVIECCGRYYNLVYMLQIMTGIVKDDAIGTYCSLGNDMVTLIALVSSCFLITNFKRRTILFTCGFCTFFLMLFISLTIVLKNYNFLQGYLLWLPPCFILINSIVTNLGVMPVCFTICGEIFPLEHRGLGTCITGIIFTVIYGVIMKCTPQIIDTVGIEGMYGIYGLCLFICLVILCFILNETKDKTLQEIEDEVTGNKINNELILIHKEANTDAM